jgi:hypothetical protein
MWRRRNSDALVNLPTLQRVKLLTLGVIVLGTQILNYDLVSVD